MVQTRSPRNLRVRCLPSRPSPSGSLLALVQDAQSCARGDKMPCESVYSFYEAVGEGRQRMAFVAIVIPIS